MIIFNKKIILFTQFHLILSACMDILAQAQYEGHRAVAREKSKFFIRFSF